MNEGGRRKALTLGIKLKEDFFFKTSVTDINNSLVQQLNESVGKPQIPSCSLQFGTRVSLTMKLQRQGYTSAR